MNPIHPSRLARLRRGVTALEILVVIKCVGILSALVMSSIANDRSAARANDCRNRFRQLGVATHNFESAYQGLPPGLTHFYDLLPYVGGRNLYDQLQAMDTKSRLLDLRKTHGTRPLGSPNN